MEPQIIELRRSRVTGEWKCPDRKRQRLGEIASAVCKWMAAFFLLIVKCAMRVLRVTLFSVMLWLRRPVQAFAGLCAFVGLLSAPMMFFGLNDAHPYKTAMFCSGIGIFFFGGLLTWYYDELLLRLSPRPIILM